MLYDKKDDNKSLRKNIEYPFVATNFNRINKNCNSKEELFEHIVCRKELNPITLILSAKVSPEEFVSYDSYELISLYMRFKRYGMQFLYPNGYDEIPNQVLEAFDIISQEIEKDEQKKLKDIKEKNKTRKN